MYLDSPVLIHTLGPQSFLVSVFLSIEQPVAFLLFFGGNVH